MGLFDSMQIASTGMSAEGLRMDVIAENLANADTTKGADGKPYRRQEVELQQAGGSFSDTLAGVQVAGIVTDNSPLQKVYDPSSPDADKQGYVSKPNVNSVTEMVDLVTANRGYDADVQAMDTAKQMYAKALGILG